MPETLQRPRFTRFVRVLRAVFLSRLDLADLVAEKQRELDAMTRERDWWQQTARMLGRRLKDRLEGRTAARG